MERWFHIQVMGCFLMPMTLISRQTLTGTAASVTFSSIPQTYKTLKLVISGRTSTSATIEAVRIRPNGSSANGSERYVYGNGSSAVSGSDANVNTAATASTATASTFANTEITIPNYAGSSNKPFSVDVVTENNATEAYQLLRAGLWSNSAAITSLELVPASSSNFVSGSTFSLYGIS